MELFQLFGRIVVDDEASERLDDIDQKGKGIGGTLGSIAGGAAKMGVAVAAAGTVAVGAIVGLATKTAAYGDELAKTSTKLGVSVEQLQDWRFWGEQNGLTSATLERGMGRLNQRIGVAITEGGKYADALNDLGVAYQNADGSARDTNAVMADTIKALQGIEDPALRSAAASEIFGTKMARDLMPALQDGSLSIEEATAAMDEFGRMSTEQAEEAEKMNDMINEVKMAFMGMALAVGSELIPVVIELVAKFQEYLPAIQKAFRAAFVVIQRVAETFINTVVGIIDMVGDWVTNNRGKMEEIRNTFEEVFDAIVGLIQAYVGLAMTIWENYGEEIVATIIFAWDVISTVVRTALDIITGVIQTVTAIIEGDWSAAWLGIERITDAIWEGIMALIRLALDWVLSFFGTSIDSLHEMVERGFAALEAFIMKPIDAATEAAVGAFEWMEETIGAIIGRITKIVSGVTDRIESAKEAVEKFFGGAAERILRIIPGAAEGGRIVQEGLTWVGEQGPELMHLPKGATVAPLDKVEINAMGAGAGGAVTFGRGAFDGAIITDDYGVDRLMERVVQRLRDETGLKL